MASRTLTTDGRQPPADNISRIALVVLKCVILAFPMLYLCLELYPFLSISAAERARAELPPTLQLHHYSQIAALAAAVIVFKRWYFWPVVIVGFGVNLYWSIVASS